MSKLPQFLRTNPGPEPRRSTPKPIPPLPPTDTSSADKQTQDGYAGTGIKVHHITNDEKMRGKKSVSTSAYFEEAVRKLRDAAKGDDADAAKARRLLEVFDRESERKNACAAQMGLSSKTSESSFDGTRLQLGTYKYGGAG